MNSTASWAWTLLWPSLPLGVLFALALNFGLYWFFFHSKLGVYLMRGRRHYQGGPSREDLLYEIRHAIIPESILGVITSLALTSNQPGPLPLHLRWSFSAGDIPRILAEIVGILVVYEIYYYGVHYLMHRRRLFPLTHSVHHHTRFPSPQAGTSVNLLEAALFYTFFATMIFGPFHIVALIAVSLEIKFASLTQHLGHEIFPQFVRRSPVLKYINSTRFHQLHHSDNLSRNLGFQTSFLDRAFGTINKKYLDYEKSA